MADKVLVQSISAIDTHSHINTDTPFDNEESEAYNAHLEYLNEIRKAANIEKCFVSSFASVKDPASILKENSRVAELCEQNDHLYRWVTVDPRIDATLEQAREMLGTKKCVGIKLHPPYHKYSIIDLGDKVFSLAADFGTRVLIHSETKAPHILPFADKYPDVSFIMAHLSGDADDHIGAVKNAIHQNVYTDVATVSSIKNRCVEYAVSQIGSERILFGTDTYAAGSIRGRIEYALISDQDKINILRNNALRLFADKL